MTNSTAEHKTNFWFGYALGILTGGGAAFFIGTKKGRIFLKKLVELSENFDGDISALTQQLFENLKDNAQSITQETNVKNNSNLGSLLQKIKFLSPGDNTK